MILSTSNLWFWALGERHEKSEKGGLVLLSLTITITKTVINENKIFLLTINVAKIPLTKINDNYIILIAIGLSRCIGAYRRRHEIKCGYAEYKPLLAPSTPLPSQ